MTKAEHAERLDLITAAALALARATHDDIDECIVEVMGEVTTFAGADRAHVFLFDPNGCELSCTHEWCGSAIDAFRNDMQYMPADLFPWLLRQLRSTDAIAVERLDELPVAASGERGILRGLSVQSAMAVPLVHDTLLGFLEVEAVRQTIAWPDATRASVRTVAELITSAITRRDAWDGQEKLIAELRLALTEVSTLSGLLPICASCKNVRDDKGYWHRVEAYLHNHSDLEFTHGLCPECAERLRTNAEPTSV